MLDHSCQVVTRQYHPCQGVSSLVSRDHESQAVVDELVRLTGPGGSDQSPREIEAEMLEALGEKVSHERLRQFLEDDWETISRAVRRRLRAYVEWKRAAIARLADDGLDEIRRRKK